MYHYFDNGILKVTGQPICRYKNKETKLGRPGWILNRHRFYINCMIFEKFYNLLDFHGLKILNLLVIPSIQICKYKTIEKQ